MWGLGLYFSSNNAENWLLAKITMYTTWVKGGRNSSESRKTLNTG